MLKLESIYTDPQLGRLVYIGRIGYELNIKGAKGKAVFVTQHLSLVYLSKKDISLLK